MTAFQYRTSTMPCPTCVKTMDVSAGDRPGIGVVTWQLVPSWGKTTGKAIKYECPNGHSSATDPDLLKAFPPRDF